ncbi:MAG: redoxin domain-containing protein [Bacteroidota bacterium]|nr:redoxin domain-containing protein [Bacteroidota bacterium]
MRRIAILFFALFPSLLFAQEGYTIKGQLTGKVPAIVYFTSVYGERATLLDSVKPDPAGKFLFKLRPGLQPGLYRLVWGKDQLLDLVFNKENIEFSTVALFPADSIHFISSDENRIYYFFRRIDRLTQSKMEVLTPVLDYYPDNDDYYLRSVMKYEFIQKEESRILDSLASRNPGFYAIRMFKTMKTPFISGSLLKDDRINWLKTHFFDGADFQDTLLIHSNVWSNKAISYLALYSDNRLSQKQLETEFIKAVTVILSSASGNAEVFKFLLDYIVGGFDKYHFDDVITYIADNFQDPFACEDQARKTALQKKLDNFKKIAIGKQAPDFDLTDNKGKHIKLSASNSEYTLVVFWSSECGHCAEMLPKVKKLYEGQKHKRFEIIAVSIDTSRTEWTGFLKQEKLNWINVCDFKGFAGPATEEYNIYATPTMFLLDRNKKILAKPVSYRELEEALKENGLL